MTTAHHIVKKNLKLSRKVAKFVPRLLTDEQKRMRVECCRQNLQRLKDDPYLLDKIITGDESPVHLHNPENKFDSSAWLPCGADHPVKALHSRLQRWMMLTVFFDSCGTILVEFTEEIIDTDAYVETLRHLCERIRKKRPGMWKGGVDSSTDREFIIHQDNASPHTSNITLAFLFDQDLLAHPRYSPDLAPCDFWLFPTLKKKLRGIKHRNLNILKASVKTALKSIDADEFQGAMIKWITRWRKCIAAEGNYFEGRGISPLPDPHFDMVPNPDDTEEEQSTDDN